MIKLVTVNIPELLNKKYVQWQYQEGERKTLDDFAVYIGVKRPLLSMWMSGTRAPGEEYKKRLISLFGNDAIEAFGEDPDLYAVKENWQYLSPELRSAIRQQTEEHATHNEAKRTSPKRRTATP